MKRKYIEWKANKQSLHLAEHANMIIAEYNAKGYVLTLRQLYYQFVARDIIPNTERSYKNLGSLVTKARMGGVISWNAIEDRNRSCNMYGYEESHSALVGRLQHLLNLDLWARQPQYVEVWVEKEALGNVVSRACNKYDVPHLSCKGYLSASEAWRAGRRFRDQIIDEGKECHLIHLGDFDPSGLDMTRDNKERVDLFSEFPNEVNIHRIALNLDQVKQYKPPPNPAKKTDSRWKEYKKKFGTSSWELDALRPEIIEDLITDKLKGLIDFEIWDKTLAKQDKEKDIFRKLAKKWPLIHKYLNWRK